jgi:hypothetical protein
MSRLGFFEILILLFIAAGLFANVGPCAGCFN